MTIIALVSFVFCVFFSLFYWQVFHAILIRSTRYDLFAIRDDIRRLAAEHGLVDSFVFRKLERLVNDSIKFGPHISLVSFLRFMAMKPPTDTEGNQRFNREAPKEFQILRDRAAKALIVTMMLNSPWIVLFGSLVAPALWAVGKLSRFLLYRGAETFVETIPANAVPC